MTPAGDPGSKAGQRSVAWPAGISASKFAHDLFTDCGVAYKSMKQLYLTFEML